MRKALLLVFTLSGFSGLIYESVWTHYLRLFLGHAAYAQSLVDNADALPGPLLNKPYRKPDLARALQEACAPLAEGSNA